MRLVLAILFLVGCSGNQDSVMWACQLEVQKDNAGRSNEAEAERRKDIEACLSSHGYRLVSGNPSCQQGSLDSSCYRRK
jgi:hypothetical protein